MKDVISLHKVLCSRNLWNKAKMHGTLNVVEHGSLVSVWLLYKRSWLHWCCSRAFTIRATYEEFSEEEALLDYWDGSWIRGFGNVYNIRIMAKLGSMTYQAKLLKRPEDMRKDRTALRRLGLMVRLDGIRLDGLTWWIA